jgi:hypothetical protein
MRDGDRGAAFIEVLVVLVLFCIVAAVAVLAMGMG